MINTQFTRVNTSTLSAHAPQGVSTKSTLASVERCLPVLRRADLFSSLSDSMLRKMAASFIERAYSSGATIVQANETGSGHFYVVAEGEVAVVLQAADGKDSVLATLCPGDFFGEMSILDEAPRAATARSVKEARVLCLPREEFQKYLKECPELTLALLTEMNRRLRHTNRQVAGLSYRSMQGRVASALLGLMEERGMRQREGGLMRVLIRNRPTQQFLAEMAGTTRESVSRTLAAWVRQGWLSTRGRDLCIMQEAHLRALVV